MRKRFWIPIIFLCLCLQNAPADLFTPARKLNTLKTEHFSIIFPKESRSAAEYLAREAEGIYDEVAEALNAPKTLRIPVVITPDSEELNGSCTLYPSTRIVLYQAPASPNDGFAVYNDDLRKLFMHELTHAVSMTIRDPVWRFLAAVFTDAIAPAVALSSGNFREGVTVSLESRDGFGRAADTDFMGIVQQDIIEGRFKSFAESAGLWEGYPYGIYYIYGGLFSRYLQETYGMEAYASVWRQLGKGDFIAGMEGLSVFKGAFERSYGFGLDEAWEDFRRYASLKRPVVTAVNPLSSEFEYVGAAATDGKRFFWSESDAVKAYDPLSGQTRKIIDSDGAPNRISLSPDGERLLISTVRVIDSLPKLKLRIRNLKKKRWESANFPTKLREAAWLPDGKGIAACRTNGYTMDLVRVENGNMDVLFKGSERFVPSCPCPFGSGELAFLLKADGVVRLARIDLKTKAVRILDAGTSLESVRFLSSDGSGLSFSWDVDRSLYKLGRYDDVEGLSLQRTPLSGGVRYPVEVGGDEYYIGAFSEGHRPMSFPKDNPDLAMDRAESQWIDFERDAAEVSVYDLPPSMEAAPYNPLPWIFIPQLRYPILTVKETSPSLKDLATYVNGAGIHGYGEDPTRAHSLSWTLAYKWFDEFAQAEATYACGAFPMNFSLSAYDLLASSAPKGDTVDWLMTRRLGFAATAYQKFDLLPLSRSFVWKASGAWNFISEGAGTDGAAVDSPYLWAFAGSILPFGVSVDYRDLVSSDLDGNSDRGVELWAAYQAYLEPSAGGAPKGLAIAKIAVHLPVANFRILAAGALSAYPGLELGPSGPGFANGDAYLARCDYPYYPEYSSGVTGEGPFYLYGEARTGYRFRIDEAIRGTDAYVKAFSLSGGYRASYAGTEYLNSLFGLATVEAGWTRGLGLNLGFDFGLEIDCLLSREDYPGHHPIAIRPTWGYSY